MKKRSDFTHLAPGHTPARASDDAPHVPFAHLLATTAAENLAIAAAGGDRPNLTPTAAAIIAAGERARRGKETGR